MLIEIFADLVCPWCYIGKHRLDSALALRPQADADLRWLPFQLNPDMPEGGMDRAQYLALKFGTGERARIVQAALRQAAEHEGVPLNLEAIGRVPNTLDAHCLIRMADRLGSGTAATAALFSAYFVEGRDIGDRAVLADIGAAIGLPRDETVEELFVETERAAVRASDEAARELGIQAVPCFVFNHRYVLLGAQDPTAFLPLLDLAETEAAAEAALTSRAVPHA